MNKKEICENTSFCEIATWITDTALDHTLNGSYYVHYEKIADKFNVSEQWIKEHTKEILDSMNYDIVEDCDIEDDSFRMYLYLQYCCEHCDRYRSGNRSYENCAGSCDCWCDTMEEN